MRRAVLAFGLVLSIPACGSRLAETGGAKTAAAAHEPPKLVSTTPAALLSRTADEGEVVLHLSVARAHPLGARIEPYVLAWPGWGQTIAALTPHPLAELDWVVVVGPRETAKERMLSRTTEALADATVDARLAAPAGTDGVLRVLLRNKPHLVVAAPVPDTEPLTRTLLGVEVLDPESENDEFLRADLPHPHTAARQVPEQVRRLKLRVFSRPGGGAEAFVDLLCDDAETAGHVADSIRAEVAHANNFVVRLMTQDLLGHLAVDVDGSTVKLRLPADRGQLESLATLAAGLIPPR